MRFIELHDTAVGKPFLVNIYKIDLIREQREPDGGDSYTRIDLADSTVYCKETSHEIMLKIRG